ncbi:Uncharacterized protein family (UPF0014) [Musa troglodytarum]|uniref:Uncharacterized protein family (UPF0014) n=1 Tax=Musa troglodytarum TaxID=320322 RepID=A0A9E7KXE9_9LILI|nr:Uncharacterized protein family (UPF0014) [Musa troglodytarum]
MDLYGQSSSWMGFLGGMIKPVVSTAVVAMAVILSFSQKLGLEGEMVHATARSFLQLSVVGFVLQFIFAQKNAGWVLLAYLFMVSVAGYTAGRRAAHVPRGKWIAGASILIGTTATMFLPIALDVLPFTPQFFIPVSGMMVGHAMAVTGVTMKQLHEDIKAQKNLVALEKFLRSARVMNGTTPCEQVEAALALGATPRQATMQQATRSLVVALSPDLDSVKTVGLITLPGTMTGLIMGGASPMEAIQLQIVITNMLVGACVMSSILSTYLCLPVFFTKAYQLDHHVLAAAN